MYLDWGKASGVQSGDQFKVYRPGETLKHPVTGEILGQAEVALGQGILSTVEDKYSTGKLVETPGDIKAGDRTRYLQASAPVVATTASVNVAVPANVPKELWRSESLGSEAVGIAIGDVVGDGKKEVVVAFRDHVEVFRWNGQKLESQASFKSRSYSNYLAIDTGDMDGSGHDKIFASLFVEAVKRTRTIVLDYSSGTLHEVGRFDGFVRAFDHPDGKRELIWQDTSLSHELRIKPPAPLTKTAKGFREGSPMKLKLSLNDEQLFGFAWGDWDGDGSEDFAFLQNGERLRILFKDTKWSSGEVYGGTNADFAWENEQMGSIYPRLQSLKTSSGKCSCWSRIIFFAHADSHGALKNLQKLGTYRSGLEWSRDVARLDASGIRSLGGFWIR